ncbi:MAG: hypothetical protein BWK76_10115 [Desulfobulbaceae bacterium A2]|nr:MAG: hypothetical protein BWK76_10115 [Desulfobulbaceae bacterium A2]
MSGQRAEGELVVVTGSRLELVDVTGPLHQALAEAGVGDGVCQLYCPHTTAGVTINEGADPDVRRDIIAALEAMVPRLPYRHQEGNSPAHVMCSLMGCSALAPVRGGRLRLGTWQRVFFCEFDGPRTRRLQWIVF